MQENKLKEKTEEYKSIFKDDFHRLDIKIEQVYTRIEQVHTKIESTNSNTLKWFMGGFITIVLLILGLFLKT